MQSSVSAIVEWCVILFFTEVMSINSSTYFLCKKHRERKSNGFHFYNCLVFINLLSIVKKSSSVELREIPPRSDTWILCFQITFNSMIVSYNILDIDCICRISTCFFIFVVGSFILLILHRPFLLMLIDSSCLCCWLLMIILFIVKLLCYE